MWSLGTTQLISLLLAVATVAALCGFITSAVARRNKRRTRGIFLVGFFSGLMAGAILRGRRRGLNVLGAPVGRADVRPLRAWIRSDTVRFAARVLTFAASRVRLG
jgi:small basic protein